MQRICESLCKASRIIDYGSDSSGGRDTGSGEGGESESLYAAPDSQDPEGGEAGYDYSAEKDGTPVQNLVIPTSFPGDAPIYRPTNNDLIVFARNTEYQLEENCRMIELPNGNPLFYSKAAPDEYWCVHLVGFQTSQVSSGSTIPDPCAAAPDGTWYCTDPRINLTAVDLELADDAGYLP